MSKILTKPEELESSVPGSTISICGIAENAKAGAVAVIEGDVPLYIRGLNSWPDAVYGQRVLIEGVVSRRRIYPQVTEEGGIVSQGMSGEPWVIEMQRYQVEN